VGEVQSYDWSRSERSAPSRLPFGKEKDEQMVNKNVQKITQCHNYQLHGRLLSKFTRKMN
jgi:hypothetical protein